MCISPPHSPDLNPIEFAFSKVKSELKSLEVSMLSSDNEIVLLAAFAAITEADCIDWIKHCGYK